MVKKIILLSIVPALFLLSCSVKQEATIHSDGSGNVSFDFELQEYFLDTILEMTEIAEESPTLEKGEIFDIAQIKKDFEEQSAVTLERISSPKPSKLTGSIRFDDIEAVFKEEGELIESDVIKIEREEGNTTIVLHLNRENFSQISTLFPVMKNPFFQMFGPEENANTTKTEYLEMIGFAFGEAGVQGVQNSEVQLIVHVDGTIVSQEGGTVEGNSVVFTIPLLRMLLLEEPIHHSITYK